MMNTCIDDIFQQLITSYEINHRLPSSIPNMNFNEYIKKLVSKISKVLLPEYYSSQEITKNEICELNNLLNIILQLTKPDGKSNEDSLLILKELPIIRNMLLMDIEAAFAKDPAATSYSEIALTYPGIFAITVHRIANRFYTMGYNFLARMLSEHAHSKTGIDIHPGAMIGYSFFIDHGTGIVIGETSIIGDHVTIYQNVTLGAFSFQRDEKGKLMKNTKRHPTIEDNVTIYAGATILGGDTIVVKGL
jgi:serine O-acetyltransferase